MTDPGKNPRILMLLGGKHHDFDRFEQIAGNLFSQTGWDAISSRDLDDLCRLDRRKIGVVLMFTCFVDGERDREGGGFSARQTDALIDWTRRGGGVLSLHSANVAARANPPLRRLFGGAFLAHPPVSRFTVHPVAKIHPITEGVTAFQIEDEFYRQTVERDVAVHMAAYDGETEHPMVWSRREARGRVVHIAPGHHEAAWMHSPWQRLMLQSVRWLAQT